MIAADSSSLRRYLDGRQGLDVNGVALALKRDDLIVTPVVIAELLSDPALPLRYAEKIFALKTLELQAGYWFRCGELRANTLREGHKAKLADVLIAQSCIDHNIALITNDADFRHFVRAGLKLA